MIIDLDEVRTPTLAPQYDVCIAGAGVAGIVIAKTLAERGRRVLLLEAGGEYFSERSQDVYRGAVVGHEYFDLDVTRLRFLGGSSNHWGGWSRPLDAHDFGKHAHIDGSGWPIGFDDVNAYSEATAEILGIEPVPRDKPVAGSAGDLNEIFFRRSQVWFKDKYGPLLASSENIDLLLRANLLDISLDPTTGRVATFQIRGYGPDDPMLEARAESFVLSLGGLENPRALLNANKQRANGVGNENDLVGRYFMEHPHFDIGHYFVDQKRTDLGRERRIMAPSRQFLTEAGIANCGIRLEVVDPVTRVSLLTKGRAQLSGAVCKSNNLVGLVKKVRPGFRCRQPFEDVLKAVKKLPLDGAGLLRTASEQVPLSSSRVLLADETDQFGRRRLALNWQLSPLDKETIRICGLAVGRYLAEANIGRARLFDWVLDPEAGFPGLDDGEELAGNHHMGTTRMGLSATDSVVNANCQVHGVGNLYMAGSSVFRTGGHANPTFTIVQLALRLADHLAAS